MPRPVVKQVAIQVEGSVNVYFAGGSFVFLMVAGEHADSMPPFLEPFGHLVAPLGIATRAGGWIGVGKKEDSQ